MATTLVYNAHMEQMIWGKRACRCVQCAWVWFAEGERPKICPNRKCRSRKWNADLGQLENLQPVDVRVVAAGPSNAEFKAAETRYRKCSHGGNEYTCGRVACKIKTGRA